MAPFNRFYLLFGIFTTSLILVALPFTFFLILALIVFPISIITFLSVLVLFFMIALIFSGIGLILGAFAISHEGILRTLTLAIEMVFWASCILYPYEIFPSYIQRIIDLNPLYYIFDFLRYTWIENDFILSINSHPFHFVILVSCSILLPCIGVYLFNYIFKKFGIVGY